MRQTFFAAAVVLGRGCSFVGRTTIPSTQARFKRGDSASIEFMDAPADV
jgi:hypothetical protein